MSRTRLGYSVDYGKSFAQRAFDESIPAQVFTTQSLGDASNGLLEGEIYASIIRLWPGQITSFWTFMDSAAPNIAVNLKVGLYNVSPTTLRPTSVIGTNNRVLTLTTGNTYYYNRLSISADPINILRPSYYAICFIAEKGRTSTPTAVSAGTMRAIMNHEIPLPGGGVCSGDYVITNTTPFTYATGLPADFSSTANCTYTNTRGNKPAAWNWGAQYWRPY